jgi:glycosyltransferase 2 family protein
LSEVTLNRRRVVAGVRFFLVLTILGITVVFFMTEENRPWSLLSHLDPGWFAIAILLVGVDFVTGAARIHIFLRRRYPGSFTACFKANLANIFLAAATPFQTGGGPAQLYVLRSYGVPYSRGVAVSILNFVATLFLLALIGTAVWTTLPRELFGGGALSTVLNLSRAGFYAALALFALFLLMPAAFGRVAAATLRSIGRLWPAQSGRMQRYGAATLDFTLHFRSHMKDYSREERPALIWNYLLTVVLYFNKCLVAWVVIRAMGLDADFWLVVRLQLLIIFFLYFAPTPGASFVAEVGISSVMALVLPARALLAFTVLWRFFTTYFGVLLGSVVLLRIMARPGRAEPAGEAAPPIRAG